MARRTPPAHPRDAIRWLLLALLPLTTVAAQSVDLGNGFVDHGVATPISNHRGTVATVDGEGRNVVLVWLYDHRGGYALLMIDATTGSSEQFATPFPPGGDGPFASLLSSRNRYYAHFNGHFCEFDPVRREFTFVAETARGTAMGMTEDDRGTVWSVTYPSSGVVAFDPEAGELTDHGHVHRENWAQYQRHVAVDDEGWLWFSVGNTASQIVAFDPREQKAHALLETGQREKGTAFLYRDRDGRVYGQALKGHSPWLVLRGGESEPLAGDPPNRPVPVITGPQTLVHREFENGERLVTCDLVDRELVVEDPATEQRRELAFDYTSEGAHLMGLMAAPDGSIVGGTMFPMRFFRYDPDEDAWINRASHGQWNTITAQGGHVLVGGYGGGFLLEWDPAREWVPTVKRGDRGNPFWHLECTPSIHRPHDLLALPDGETVVLAGTPAYGYTGGGLLFFHRPSRRSALRTHEELLPWQSTYALAALPDGTVVGGTTVSAGTGGERLADQAELYLLDPAERRIVWHDPLIPGTHTFTDLCIGSRGLVYGFSDRKRFFVFDPSARAVVHSEDVSDRLGLTAWQQGPRVFVQESAESTFALFRKGIVRVDPDSFALDLLAASPVPIESGGAWHDGRVWFASGSHVYSYAVPEAAGAR